MNDFNQGEAITMQGAKIPSRIRLTERQEKKSCSAKRAQYGAKNNKRTGFKDKTTANKFSTSRIPEGALNETPLVLLYVKRVL